MKQCTNRTLILHPTRAYKSNEMEIHIEVTRRINPIAFQVLSYIFSRTKAKPAAVATATTSINEIINHHDNTNKYLLKEYSY